MGDFRQFLNENDDSLAKIKESISTMGPEEIDEFGFYLFAEFFDSFEDGVEDADAEEIIFTHEDVLEMIQALGSEMYPDVLDMLDEVSEEEFEEILRDDDGEFTPGSIPDYSDIDESVSRIMLSKNRNRKRRKFMAKSKTKMRQSVAQRKRIARQNRTKVKRYYRANKSKIKAYQKSRRTAIKSGKHIVKVRKNGG